MDHLRHMTEFFEAVRARLMKGIVTYEDKSFSKDPAELIEELRQEALDLAGWSFVLFCRLQAMTEALEGVGNTPNTRLTRIAPKLDSIAINPAENKGIHARPESRLVGAEALADLSADRSRR